ncbi:MAG TPA: DUF1385 domain-containing protein [Candidatus Paceibacterota bacterium]|nr:DUF1385 domain-containing protein [Candidatus Pacearchaeota archaeon]HRZ51413.1 DUF1385 domain-containing protein [Candidatus Paceibacterota bacterium]HSA37135.1 DUF1385 domain-containing protein [Candidatus Paceibacterota bacterium]
MAVRIIGGKSLPRSISVVSDRFTSTAICGPDKKIVCRVKKLPGLTKYVLGPRKYPIPKTLKLFLFLVSNFGIKDLFFFLLLFGAILSVIEILGLAVPGGTATVVENFWILDVTSLALIGVVIKRSIGRWHGAEHMAIAAYVSAGKIDIETIKAQNRIDPHCGGRIAIGFMIAQLVPDLFFKFPVMDFLPLASFFPIALQLLLMEAVLQIDAHKGLDKLPITSQLAYLLQRHVTTSVPGEIELETARQAVLGLIEAHESLPAD